MRALGVVLVFTLSGCAVAEELAGPSAGDELHLALEGNWTTEEKSEIRRSLDLWREASNGGVTVRLVADDGDATLMRGPVVGSFESYSRSGRWMRIDADALASDGWGVREGVGALTGSLVGRMLGMPMHNGQGFLSCEDITPEVTADDLVSCRASSFCSGQ